MESTANTVKSSIYINFRPIRSVRPPKNTAPRKSPAREAAPSHPLPMCVKQQQGSQLDKCRADYHQQITVYKGAAAASKE